MQEKELKFSKNHLWVKMNGEIATVGLSNFAQQELGDIVFVEMPEKGKKAEKDETIGTIESVKSVSDLISPLSGEIVETNTLLEDKPETINSDPYGKGWIVKIKVSSKGELSELMDFEAYNKFSEAER